MKSPVAMTVLAAACAALATPLAHALYRNPDGMGQALVFPYYTTRSVENNAFNTYLSIVNHTADTKALRVRFREGQNGREVAGFNLYLGAGDAWTGAVVPSTQPNAPARVITADRSCVSPPFSADASAPVPFLEFRNALYAGTNSDGLGEGFDRTREGYLEVIEMATVTGIHAEALRPRAGDTAPADCGVGALSGLLVAPPGGGLSGTLTLINVGSGLDFTANAEALADLSTRSFYRPATDPYPDFLSAEVDPVTHFVAGGKSYRVDWSNRALAVSAAFAHARLHNEIILDSLTRSGTDWVVTFPTRRLHPTGVSDPGPFAPSYDADRRTIPFSLFFNSREGNASALVTSCAGLCPPATQVASLKLPYAATVVGFRAGATGAGAGETTTVLGSTNGWMVTIPTGSQNGSASLLLDGFHTTPRFPRANAQTLRLSDGSGASESLQLDGIPVVGFAVRTFRNGSVACAAGTCQANYGGLFPHRSTMTVSP